jgi:hypothetical protein
MEKALFRCAFFYVLGGPETCVILKMRIQVINEGERGGCWEALRWAVTVREDDPAQSDINY